MKRAILTALVTTLAAVNLGQSSGLVAQRLAVGVISMPNHHEAPNEEREGELFFSRSSLDYKTSAIYVSALNASGERGEARLLSFSGGGHEAGAALSADGLKIYFSSHRETPIEGLSEEWNLWRANKKQDGQWGAPEILPPPINSHALECCPATASDGTLYFSSNRDGTWDIFRTLTDNAGKVGVEKLGDTVNSGGLLKNPSVSGNAGEWPSYVSPDHRFLLFSSIREGGFGGDDVYVAFHSDGSWQQAQNLGPAMNTGNYEDNAMLSNDGKRLLFSRALPSHEGGRVADVYEIAVKALEVCGFDKDCPPAHIESRPNL